MFMIPDKWFTCKKVIAFITRCNDSIFFYQIATFGSQYNFYSHDLVDLITYVGIENQWGFNLIMVSISQWFQSYIAK